MSVAFCTTVAAAPALQITDTEMRILAEGGAFEAGQPVLVRRQPVSAETAEADEPSGARAQQEQSSSSGVVPV